MSEPQTPYTAQQEAVQDRILRMFVCFILAYTALACLAIGCGYVIMASDNLAIWLPVALVSPSVIYLLHLGIKRVARHFLTWARKAIAEADAQAALVNRQSTSDDQPP